MPGKALRLTPARCRALIRLYEAGERGEPVLTFPFPARLVDYELAVFYSDPTRVLSQRIRLTQRGRQVAATLCLTKEN